MNEVKNKKRIAFLGECMVELRGQPFDDIKVAFGGDTLNAALYCARLSEGKGFEENIETHYVTALGDDGFSDAMIAAWEQEGIDCSLVQRFSEYQPGMYAVVVDDTGERSFCYWRSESAARRLLQHPNFSAVAESLERFSCLVFSGISLAILHDRESFIHLLARLRKAGVFIVFDTNYRPALWENSEEAQAWCKKALSNSDMALVTFDDETLLWGDESPEQTCSRIQNLGVNAVVVKQGEYGALYSEMPGADLTRVPAVKVDTVVDTTAAGDAFNAGFLSSYLNGEGLDAACKQGHAIASKVIQFPGAIMPRN